MIVGVLSMILILIITCGCIGIWEEESEEKSGISFKSAIKKYDAGTYGDNDTITIYDNPHGSNPEDSQSPDYVYLYFYGTDSEVVMKVFGGNFSYQYPKHLDWLTLKIKGSELKRNDEGVVYLERTENEIDWS